MAHAAKSADLEKASATSDPLPAYDYGASEETVTGSTWSRFRDSFKRNPNARMEVAAVDEDGRPLDDQLPADHPPTQPALAMKLKDRHLQMIAIGGSIGE
jgi:yeast amino acid transporter